MGELWQREISREALASHAMSEADDMLRSIIRESVTVLRNSTPLQVA